MKTLINKKTVFEKIYFSVHKYKFTFLAICSAMALSACVQSPERERETENTALDQPPSDKGNLTVSTGDREKYKQGLIALNNSDYLAAEDIFNELIDDIPELAGPYSNLALIYFKKKDYEKSLLLVNNALSHNPKQAQAYHLRGQISLATKKIHDAKKDYIKAIELKPDYINAHYNLALLYDIYLQEIPLAIKHYETYLSLVKKPDETTKEWVNHLKGMINNG